MTITALNKDIITTVTIAIDAEMYAEIKLIRKLGYTIESLKGKKFFHSYPHR